MWGNLARHKIKAEAIGSDENSGSFFMFCRPFLSHRMRAPELCDVPC